MTTNQDAIEAAARALLFRETMSDDGLSLDEMARIAYDSMAPIIAAQAKADALREAAEYIGQCIDIGADADSSPQDTMTWLRARATTIEGDTP